MDLTIPADKGKPAGGFDYAMLDKTTAKFAKEKAAEIWQRHERMVGDWIANAEAFEEVAAAFKKLKFAKGRNPAKPMDETFKDWIERETPYSADTAGKMITTLKRLPRGRTAAPPRISHRAAMELTKTGTVPEQIVGAVLDRAQTEHIGWAEAQAINRAARNLPADKPLPSPDAANAIARETGKPQVASDGKLYVGLTDEEVEQGKEENRLDFGIIDGVKFFSSIAMTPEEWIARESDALMEWSVTDPPPIKEAADWLQGLDKAWKRYAKTKAVNGKNHASPRDDLRANR